MICPKCGSECEDNLMFCTKCGTKINSFISESVSDEKTVHSSKPFEDIVGGISLEEDDDDLDGYLNRDLRNGKSKVEPVDEDDFEDNFEDEFEDEYIKKSKSSNKGKNKPAYNSGKNKTTYSPSKKTKKSGKGKVALIILAGLLSVVAAVFITIGVKKTSMTKKFDKYYAQGSQFYDVGNYKDAKTQFINASNNAFTSEQKIKSYEMVYKIDAMIGGYDEEEMKYLEALIDINDSNINYYKDLIVLYQNNEMESKIDSLIASAPVNLQQELRAFDGTIPVASVEEGSYDKPLEVELTAAEGVTIYYTTDGSNVEDSVTKQEYITPIKFEEEGAYTIRAYSVDKNGKSSKEMSVKYTLDFGSVTPPSVSLVSGKYTEEKSIEVTADAGCTIYYTEDGTTPTDKSKKYKKPIKLPKGDSLYYFVAIDAEGVSSSVVTRAYDYTPEYNYSYDSALSSLTMILISKNIFENKYGEFANGDLAYFEYNSVEEIGEESYYIITCEIEDQNGANKSTKQYAVSCTTGECSEAIRSSEGYELNEIK